MQNGLKRKASCFDSTQQRADTVIQGVLSEYAANVEELSKAYQKILKKTKKKYWMQLVKSLGSEILEAQGLDYNTFFIKINPSLLLHGENKNSFSLLSQTHNNNTKRYNDGRHFQTREKRWSSGDEADGEAGGYDEDGEDDDTEDLEVLNHLVLEELKMSKYGVVVRLIPGTQFTTPGGRTACTAISFAAAYRMSMIAKLETLEHEVNWDRVLVLGTKIWTIWNDNNSKKQNGRQFISVEDIRTMPLLSRVFGKVWETLNKTETEKVGYINDEINRELGGEAGGLVNLRDALASMKPCQTGSGTAVAVICGGRRGGSNSSLSLWKNKANQFALFNSHGSQAAKNSSLYLMRDLRAATHCVYSILSHMPHTQLDRRIAGQISCVLYSMQILRFEFTDVDLAYS